MFLKVLDNDEPVRGRFIGRVQFHVVSKNATCGWIDLIRVEAINDIIDEKNKNKRSKKPSLEPHRYMK